MSKRAPRKPKAEPAHGEDQEVREKAHKRPECLPLVQAAYFAMAKDPRSPGLGARRKRALCLRAVDFVVDQAKPPSSLAKGRIDQTAFLNDLWRAAISAVQAAANPPSPLSSANAVRTSQE